MEGKGVCKITHNFAISGSSELSWNPPTGFSLTTSDKACFSFTITVAQQLRPRQVGSRSIGRCHNPGLQGNHSIIGEPTHSFIKTQMVFPGVFATCLAWVIWFNSQTNSTQDLLYNLWAKMWDPLLKKKKKMQEKLPYLMVRKHRALALPCPLNPSWCFLVAILISPTLMHRVFTGYVQILTGV